MDADILGRGAPGRGSPGPPPIRWHICHAMVRSQSGGCSPLWPRERSANSSHANKASQDASACAQRPSITSALASRCALARRRMAGYGVIASTWLVWGGRKGSADTARVCPLPGAAPYPWVWGRLRGERAPPTLAPALVLDLSTLLLGQKLRLPDAGCRFLSGAITGVGPGGNGSQLQPDSGAWIRSHRPGGEAG